VESGDSGGADVLRELRVRNYAVIDEARLELGPGLNVLSGETGAGKSILVGALSLLLGERADSDVVRAGEESAVVEAVFDVGDRPEIRDRCREAGLDLEEGWLILRRELQREGRNRVWANGSPTTVSLAGELGTGLVDLHGQHEHQALLRRADQRRILDAFAGAREQAERVEEHYRRWQELLDRAERLRRKSDELEERADYLRFKAEEIEEAELEPGEEQELEEEARRLSNSEELISLSGELYRRLYASEDSLVDRLGQLRSSVAELADIDAGAEEFTELYETGLHALQELGRRLGEYETSVDHDPARLDAIRGRLDEIYRLQRKYGETIEKVLAEGRKARDELDRLEGAGDEIETLEERAAEVREELSAAAEVLTEERREAADSLEEEITAILPALGMDEGRFEVHFDEREEPGPHGAEDVEFRVTLNAGFEPGPLSRIASGGELSRVMLALKTVLAEVDEIPCLVFDEIDAGVGGEVAHQVAERLASVAGRHQVFVITHLPQIAARADAHYRVEKSQAGGRAATRVRLLEGDERVSEVARMLGGDPESEVSRRHARELLETGEERRTAGTRARDG